MRTFLMLLLAIALLLGLTSITYVLGDVTSALGLAFLAAVTVIGLVIASAGNSANKNEDPSNAHKN